jgi:hypothetical protein
MIEAFRRRAIEKDGGISGVVVDSRFIKFKALAASRRQVLHASCDAIACGQE